MIGPIRPFGACKAFEVTGTDQLQCLGRALCVKTVEMLNHGFGFIVLTELVHVPEDLFFSKHSSSF